VLLALGVKHLNGRTDRQIDREAERQRDRQTERQRGRQTDREIDREAERGLVFAFVAEQGVTGEAGGCRRSSAHA